MSIENQQTYSANFPDTLLLDYNTSNPKLYSVNQEYSIEFGLSPENRYDFEEYTEFLNSAIRNFRNSKFYKHYKGYLYSLGINKCAFHPHIQNDSEDSTATLEMHHCMLTIFDIATLITEHYLNTLPKEIAFTEFDLVEIIKNEHKNNNVPIVFLCKNCHALFHHSFLYVEPDQIFGNYINLFYKYKNGWSNNTILEKMYRYLNRSLKENIDYQIRNRNKLLELRDSILDWSKMNNIIIENAED